MEEAKEDEGKMRWREGEEGRGDENKRRRKKSTIQNELGSVKSHIV